METRYIDFMKSVLLINAAFMERVDIDLIEVTYSRPYPITVLGFTRTYQQDDVITFVVMKLTFPDPATLMEFSLNNDEPVLDRVDDEDALTPIVSALMRENFEAIRNGVRRRR